MGLTSGDIAELTYFFTTPDAGALRGEVLAAQTYEPKGSGTYDPYTDTRLVTLVTSAVRASKSEATRVKRVLEHLLEATDGRKHFDILRRAFEPLEGKRQVLPLEEFRYPEVARITPAALEAGVELAQAEERTRLLEAAYEAARVSGCSSISTAARVLETDRRLELYGVRVHDSDVRSAAGRAIERAMNPRDAALLTAVKKQMLDLVNAAGDAYRAARDDLGASRRRDRAERRKANEDLLAELLGKKHRKERERFEARLRRAS